MTARTRTARPVVVGTLAAALVAATVGLAPQAASAATPEDGWLRVGHLSPDTKGVDVELSSLSGGKKVFELDDVTYGQVSPYQELPVGTYVLSMRAADAPDSTPVISTDVTVSAGDANTVVADAKSDFPTETDALKSTIAQLKTSIQTAGTTPSAADLAPIVLNATAVVNAVKAFAAATNGKC